MRGEPSLCPCLNCVSGQYITGKKNPAWEAGYTGYCCCREIGSYFSGEAVLDFCYCYKSATSTSTYFFFFLFASSGFDVFSDVDGHRL